MNSLEKLLDKTAFAIDSFTEFTGKLVSWLVLILVAIVSYDVGMRYLLQSGSIAIQELQWHLFSLIFLLGAAYTFKHDDHVRVDVFYQSRFMNDYRRAWINFLGGLLFLVPFCILIITSSSSFIYLSYIHGEVSPDPGGLQYRWLIKAAIPLAFSLLLVQGLSSVIKSLLIILGKPR
ncbi:MAG: TRAP transporter small permease subunit [Gammaproteobacteria bacterium]